MTTTARTARTARHQRRSSGVSERLGLRATVGVGGTAGWGGVDAAAQRARSRRRAPMSAGALGAVATFVPGTVLKSGSPELASADIWRLVLAPERDAPRLVRDGGR